jgi:hypothetical protein
MPCIADIIAVIGREAATDLQEAIGARFVRIPRQADPDHPIAQAIGTDAMQALCDDLGGLRIHIGVNYARARRNQAIETLYEAGWPTGALARRYRVSRRWVRYLTEEVRNSGRRARTINRHQRRALARSQAHPEQR